MHRMQGVRGNLSSTPPTPATRLVVNERLLCACMCMCMCIFSGGADLAGGY